MLHALLQDLHRRPHSSDHTSAYDALCQFQVMEPEKLQPLIEVKHAFRHVVQAKELFMPAIDIGNGQVLAGQLFLKRVAYPGRDVQQRKKSWRIQPAAVSQASPNDVIVVGRDVSRIRRSEIGCSSMASARRMSLAEFG